MRVQRYIYETLWDIFPYTQDAGLKTKRKKSRKLMCCQTFENFSVTHWLNYIIWSLNGNVSKDIVKLPGNLERKIYVWRLIEEFLFCNENYFAFRAI